MKCIAYCIVFAITFLFNSTMLAAEQCTVYWLHPDQPPLFIPTGYGEGMGQGDRFEKFLTTQLSGCIHSFDSANWERIVHTMKQKDNACCVALYKTPEREEFIEFSIPYQIVLSNALIIVDSRKHEFDKLINKEGYIALEEALKKGFRIGVAKGRVYRGVIDEILIKYRNDPRIIEQSSSHNMVGNLIKMMVANRIDGLIAYPFEAQYVAKTMGIGGSIVSIPIAGMDSYGLNTIGCSKTEKGKEIIKNLNAIIMQYRTTPDFMDFMGYWLEPSALKRFRAYTIKEFKK